MRTLGIALAAIGIVALLAGGIGYYRQTTILDIGGITATATEHKTLPIAPIAGALVLITGVVLLLVPRSRRA